MMLTAVLKMPLGVAKCNIRNAVVTSRRKGSLNCLKYRYPWYGTRYPAGNSSKILTRRWVSSQKTNLSNKVTSSVPPFPVRVSIVASSVGLASPFFATGGVFYLWFSYLPRTVAGRAAKTLAFVVIGGGVVKLVYDNVGPFLWNNSDFVLPFAVANGASAAFWYSIGEAIFGLELMSGSIQAGSAIHSVIQRIGGAQLAAIISTVPLAGPAIGVLTALSAPFLWPVLFKYCWSRDYQHLILGDDFEWISNLYEWIVLPVGVPVGALSGVVMHLLLQPAVYNGTATAAAASAASSTSSAVTAATAVTAAIPWARRSLPVLLALLSTAGFYFSYCRSAPDALMWHTRIDPATGKLYSFNTRSGNCVYDGGLIAESVKIKRDVIWWITSTIRGSCRSPARVVGVAAVPPAAGQVQQQHQQQQQQQQQQDASIACRMKDPSIIDLPEIVLFRTLVDILLRAKLLELQKMNKSSGGGSASGRNNVGDDNNSSSAKITHQQYDSDMKILTKQLQLQLGVTASPTELQQLMRDIELLLVANLDLQTLRNADPTAGAEVEAQAGAVDLQKQQNIAELQRIQSILQSRVLKFGDFASHAVEKSTDSHSLQSAIAQHFKFYETSISNSISSSPSSINGNGGAGDNSDEESWTQRLLSMVSGIGATPPTAKVVIPHLLNLALENLPIIEHELKQRINYTVEASVNHSSSSSSKSNSSIDGAAVTSRFQEVETEAYWQQMRETVKTTAITAVSVVVTVALVDFVVKLVIHSASKN